MNRPRKLENIQEIQEQELTVNVTTKRETLRIEKGEQTNTAEI